MLKPSYVHTSGNISESGLVKFHVFWNEKDHLQHLFLSKHAPYTKFKNPLRKHAFSNILKILPPKTEI